jgi:hypothetical protein
MAIGYLRDGTAQARKTYLPSYVPNRIAERLPAPVLSVRKQTIVV